MADRRILVLADDLTGALEVGGKFAAAGVTAEVRTAANLDPWDLHSAATALVVDTETRHASAGEAADRVRHYAEAARMAGFTDIYKKTDSTLRGNIGAELAALMEVFSGAPVLYVPAYPQMGRTVKNGSLLVDGIRVDATEFAADPFNPVTEVHIPTLLKSQCRLPISSVPVSGIAQFEPGTITVCDGDTNGDIEAAARAYAGREGLRLSAGTAGFAAYLAELVDLPRRPTSRLPTIKSALVVNGSLHPVSQQQVERAFAGGFSAIESESVPSNGPDEKWIILRQAEEAGTASLQYARKLAKSVIEVLRRGPIDALVIFGGDTAFAIVDALGNPPLQMIGEVMEGVPISKIEAGIPGASVTGRQRDLYLVTKAGSFGEVNVISDLQRLLAQESKNSEGIIKQKR